jgi:hypothetical protein
MKPVIVATITASGMFGADNSDGTWKYNASKSKSSSTSPINSQTDLREPTADGGTTPVTSTAVFDKQ